MKRMRKSKFFAYLLTLVLCIGLIPMQSFAAPSAGDKYTGGYNIETVLSKYQIFVEGDAEIAAHTVGAVAVGGTYTNGNTFGDAQVAPSYIGTYGGGGFGTGWHGTEKTYDIYYGEVAEGVSMDYYGDNWVQNPGYMNMTDAFGQIRSQSNALAQMGTKITTADLQGGEYDPKTVTIECANEYDYYVIPFDVFNTASHIYINTPGGDVDWFNENACVISIVGVNGEELAIDDWSKIQINGVHMSQVFENMSGKDPEFGKQLNFSGLNLVFNLPDANGKVSMHGLGGHLVAPNANVYIGYSDYEGGVIAKNLNGTSQGHFFPMTKMLGTSDNNVRCSFQKRKIDYTGDALIDAGLKISSTVSLEGVTRISGPSMTLSSDKKTISWTTNYFPLVLENLPDGTYIMEETKTPEPYTYKTYDETGAETGTKTESYLKAEPIRFKVSGGKIYRETSTGNYATNSITDIIMVDGIEVKNNGALCEFSKIADNGDGKDLLGAEMAIVVEGDADLSEVARVSGPEISVNGNKITWKTSKSPLKLVNLPDGNYKLVEEKAPNGYNKAADISFTIKDSVVKLGSEDVDLITMIDEKIIETPIGTDCVFSKKELGVGGMLSGEIPGAKIEIRTDVDMSAVTQKAGPTISKSKVGGIVKVISWTSGDEAVWLVGLPNGNYTMHEDSAPNGYLTTTDIDFEIKNGKVILKKDGTSEVQASNFILMTDERGVEATFSKKALKVAGDELPGAKITITPGEGVDISSVAQEEGPTVTKNFNKDGSIKSITWTSTTTPVKLLGLPEGFYIMHEDAAPNGYLKSTDIYFQVKNGELLVKNDKDQYVKAEDAVVTMVDLRGADATFSKKALSVAGDELAGAKITVTSNVDISDVAQTAGPKVTKTDKSITWTSTTTSVKLTGLPDGEYTMHEDAAPNGYLKSTDIEFKVTNGVLTVKDEDGKYVEPKNATIIMVDEVIEATFSKTDAVTTKELPGAELKLTSSNADLKNVVAKNAKTENEFKNDKGVITWTSTSTSLVLSKLPVGKYEFTETTAPEGYDIAETVEFSIGEDGAIYVDGAKVDKVEMKDEHKTYNGTFSKTSTITTGELPGAELKLVCTTEGVDLTKVEAVDPKPENKFKNDNGVITWTSGEEEFVLTKLPAGDYEFTEITAPEGYDVAETVKFTIKANGDIYVGDTKVEKVEMVDAPKSYTGTFSKTDAVTTKELPGAELQLTSTADLSGVEATNATDANKFNNDGSVISWTSTSTALTLTKLPAGDYEFTETTAPEGYEEAETIEFTIKANGDIYVGNTKVDKIEMKDTPKTYDATFSKTDAVTTKELPGAKLKLVCTTEGVDLTKVEAVEPKTENEFKNTNGVITWTSGEEEFVLTKLPAGDYEFTETTAPEGYDVAETVKFTIKPNGDIYVGEDKVDKVEMKDAPKSYTGTFSKTDAVTTKELPGAKLKLTSTTNAKLDDVIATNATDANVFSNKDGVISWTSTSTALTLTKLPVGTYEFTEITAPDGYDKAETITFTIDKKGDLYVDDEKVEKIVMEDAPNAFDGTFAKVDAVTSKEVPGAELKLVCTTVGVDLKKVKAKNATDDNKFKNADGVITWTSTEDSLTLTMLPIGTYELTEVTAPEGYKVAEKVTFTINAKGAIYVGDTKVDRVEMKDIPKDKTTDGVFSKTDAVTTKELPGAKLVLSSTDADLSEVTAKDDVEIEISKDGKTITWTSTDKPVILTELPVGSYTLTEITVPEGYEVAEEITFTVNKDGEMYQGIIPVAQNKIIMKDEPKTYDGTFSKTDAVTTKELPGAELELSSTDADLRKVEAKNATEANKFNNNEGVITWVSGNEPFVLTKLPAGTYTFTETTAPEGYKVAETVTFTIDKKGDIYVGDTKVDKVEMVDAPKKYDGEFSKTDAVTTKELPGAKLKLTSSDADLKDVDAKEATEDNKFNNDNGTITWVSGNEPVILTKLPAGTYEFTEVTAPKGYEVAETVTFTIKKNGDIYVGDTKVEKVEMVDAPKEFEGEFSKKDIITTNELPGAKLELSSTDANLTRVAAKNATKENAFKNTNGVVTWTSTDTPLVLTKLPMGTYTFTETTAPEGYDVAETVTFTIDEDGNFKQNDQIVTQIVMYDTPTSFEGTVFSKTDAVTTNELPGAKLKLTSSNANLSAVTATNATDDNKFANVGGVITWTSTDTPLILDGLPIGTYEFTETTAPDGYEVAETVKFSINADGDILVDGVKVEKVEMKDAPKTYEGMFSKTDAVTTSELPGAKLKLTSSDADLKNVTAENAKTENEFKNNDGTITWVSGEKPLILTKLPAGTYEFTETTAPEGYEVAETVEFTIDKNGNILVDGKKVAKVEMKDMPKEKTTDGVFSKTDAATTNELPGAKLELATTNADLSNVTAKDNVAIEISADGKKITWTSTTKPVILTKLPAGSYSLTETTAPDGYEVAEKITFTVDAEGNMYQGIIPVTQNKIIMKDEPKTYDGEFSKVDAVTTGELPGAKLRLESTDADISNVAAKNATQANSFSNANNVITWISTTTSLKLTNLPAGTYKFTEVTAPKGYEKAETITFTIAKNGDLMQDGKKVDKIVMEDAPITYEKEFSKQSTVTTGELPGAKLILENTDGRDISKVEIAKAAGSDDAAYAAYEFKNANGVISWTSGEAPLKLKNLPSGNYKLTEDTAPVGYNTTTAIEFSIDDNGNLYQNGQKVTRIVMVDEPKTYEAVISKIDIATSDELPGAELKLESTNGIKLNDVTLVKTSGVDESFYDQFKFKNSNGVITWTSGSDVVKLTNLPAGNYKLTENRAPIGYDVAESIEFTIEADGSLKSNGEAVDKIVMEDAPKKYSKEFSKTSAVTSEELPGAELVLTRTDDGDLSAVEIAEVEGKDYSAYKFKKSADNKTITWISGTESLKLKNLPAGDYTLTENQAPIGYEITNAVSFSIDAEGNLTVNGQPADKIVMVDEPTTYEKVFSKVDAVTSEELPGAELILESNDGYDLSAVAIAEETGVDYTDYAFEAEGSVVSWTSGDKSLKLKNLPAGSYTLTEITAPDGYAVAESITFAISVEGKLLVNDKEVDKIEMKDAPNKFIKEFSKESAVTSRELPGAKLTLTRTDNGGNLGGVEIAEVDGVDYSAYEFTKSSDKKSVSWISGEASLKITNLPAGSYTLTETTAPDGYLTAESIDFEIDNDGNITQDGQPVDKIVMVDAPILYESIFSKIDAATSDELPGAELQLESKDEDYDLSAVVIAEEDGVDYTDYQFENDGKTITWLSGESPLKLKNLPAGKYTLTENIAPEGYDDAESITFTITGDGKLMVGKKVVDKIVMKDYPEGTTPDEKDTEDDDNDGRDTTEKTTETTTEKDSEDVTTTDEASEEKTTEDEDYDNQTTTEDENYGYDDDDDYPSGNPTTTSVDTTEDQTTADSDSDKTTATTEKTTTDSDKTTATTEKTTSDSDKSTNSTDSQAQTGDDFNGVLPVVAMILAAAGIIICEDRKRKI